MKTPISRYAKILILIGGSSLLLFWVIRLNRQALNSSTVAQTIKESGKSSPAIQSSSRKTEAIPEIQGNLSEMLKVPKGIELMSRAKAVEAAQLLFPNIGAVGIPNITRRDSRVHARLLELWRLFGSDFESDLINDTSAEVVAGRRLPADIAELAKSNIPFIELLSSGKIPFLRTNEQAYRATRFYMTGLWAGPAAGDEVFTFFDSRANELPPTRRDILAYFALRDGIAEIGSGSAHDHPPIERFGTYAKARNPIYRALALQALSSAVPPSVKDIHDVSNEEHANILGRPTLSILREYADETDPKIASSVVQRLAAIPLPEAKDVLALVRDRQTVLGADEVVLHADAAMAELEKQIQKFQPKR